jgi:DNA-binding CsgD family transcriptional regulator
MLMANQACDRQLLTKVNQISSDSTENSRNHGDCAADDIRSFQDSLLGSGAMLREVGIDLDETDGLPDGDRDASQHAAVDPLAERVARLTPGQLDCLRLVDQHLSSKEIAVQLGISPHTVDQRIRHALATLGVERRAQAARIVSQYSQPYQRLIHQSPYIEGNAPSGHPEASVSIQIRHADRAGEVRGPGFNTEQRPASFWPSLQPPFATRSNPRNEMSVGQRLFWIATIAIGSAFAAGMYLAGLESLARLLKS